MIDVGTPGFAIDITAAEFKFDGQTLSAGVNEAKISIKQEEEVQYFQGLQEPQERTGGQRSYEMTMSWGTRQFLLFVNAVAAGNFDAFQNREFELTLLARPRNDTKLYQFQIHKLRFLTHEFNLDKSAGKNSVTASFLSYESAVVGT